MTKKKKKVVPNGGTPPYLRTYRPPALYGRQGLLHLAVKTVQQIFEITNTGIDVLGRIKRVLNP